MSTDIHPKVRDRTQKHRTLPIEVDGGSIYELLLVAWLAFDPTEEHTGFELGAEWFDQVAEETPAPLRAELSRLGGRGGDTWCALRGVVAGAPSPHDIDSVLKWIESLEPAMLRRGLLSYQPHAVDDPEVVERAVAGDRDALESILAELPEEAAAHYHELFSLGDGALPDRLVGVLRDFRLVYEQLAADFAAVTERAARDTRPMVKGTDPERVIERLTNGLDYRIGPGVSRLVLVPSVVLRPWAVLDQYEDVLMVVFPVPEEYIDADPDAPPGWVVKFHKALADEKRLRILRRLADQPSTLDELAEMLDVSKSTVHHHVGLLRSAGLARVSVDSVSGTKTYAIRPAALSGAYEALEQYLESEGSESGMTARSER